MNTDPRALAIVALVATAPVAIVWLVALVRGYTITVHFTRPRRRKDEDE